MIKNKMISKAVSLLIALAFTTTVYVPLAAGASDLSAEQKAKKESLEQAEEEAKEDEEHHRKTIAQQTTEYAKKRAVADFRGNTE